MADIVITEATSDDRYIYITRTVDGAVHRNRMPKETLALRASEYDLPLDDERVLDMVLLEPFFAGDLPGTVHHLYTSGTIEEALAKTMEQVDEAKRVHGAPAGGAGVLRRAAKTAAASVGLRQAMDLLDRYADPAVVEIRKQGRDDARTFYSKRPRVEPGSALVSRPVN